MAHRETHGFASGTVTDVIWSTVKHELEHRGGVGSENRRAKIKLAMHVQRPTLSFKQLLSGSLVARVSVSTAMISPALLCSQMPSTSTLRNCSLVVHDHHHFSAEGRSR